MERIAFKMKLIKGNETVYKTRHDEIWDELKYLLKKTGIADYSIFLDGETGDLFACLKIDDKKKLEALPEQSIMKKWWLFMSDIMDTHEDHSPVSQPLTEVFYLP